MGVNLVKGEGVANHCLITKVCELGDCFYIFIM